MNILYILATDPRSANYGGEQRSHVMWKALQKIGNVVVVVPVVHSHQEEHDAKNEIHKMVLERRYSPSWFAQRILSKFFPELLVPWGWDSRKMQRFCQERKFDVVVVRFLGLSVRSSAWKIAPLCVDIDDTPTTNFALANPKKIIRLFFLGVWQRYYSKKAKILWVPDEEQMKIFPGNFVSFLPNIPVPPLPDFSETVGSNDTLVFIGLLAHGPNQVALDWFLNTMWNALKKEFPELKFEICGGGLPERLKTAWSSYPGVTLHGFVKDLRPCYRKALAILTPMRIGSGTCLKVLEALRMGRPLLSTQQGLRGIRPEFRNPENGILPFEDLDSLVRNIRLLRSTDRIALQRAAVAFVQRRNTQEFIDQTLARDVREVLKGFMV